MCLNASSVGSATPPTRLTVVVRIIATTALAEEVPTARSSELRPLAEAVSVIGTAAMMRVGMAAYAIAVPAETSIAPRTICHRWSTRKTRRT